MTNHSNLRQAVLLLLSAAALAGSGTSRAQGQGNAGAIARASDTAPVPADFRACLSRLRPEALARGIDGRTFDDQTAALAPDMAVIGFLDAQPEFVTPIWDYLAALVDEERVADGREMMGRWRDVLQQVEARYGVDAHTVVAVWGVESNYGRNFGKRALLQSLSTLSCNGRRQDYFKGEFIDTLRIIQDKDVTPDKLKGSWAGAFGHTQFMPSTFLRLAVDFDGDGRRDLVDSVPDALGSTANFLRRARWTPGLAWGFEVKLPAGFDSAGTGRRNRQAVSSWSARGVTRIDGSPLVAGRLQGDTPAALLLPAGPDGPVFLVTSNFDAVFSYNAAESYALAIAHLSDRLRGGNPFARPWPTDDPGLSRAERRELQELLIARGQDIGEPDGMIGSRTREALEAVLPGLGVATDGRAGRKALEALRRHRP